jgi:hypothetical protein
MLEIAMAELKVRCERLLTQMDSNSMAGIPIGKTAVFII